MGSSADFDFLFHDWRVHHRKLATRLAGANDWHELDGTSSTRPQQVRAVERAIRRGAGRDDLLGLLPASGARNAVDCALWDLGAKSSGVSIWDLTGISPRPVSTVYTCRNRLCGTFRR